MLKALSLAALLALASPAFAQDTSCPVTLDAAIAAADTTCAATAAAAASGPGG